MRSILPLTLALSLLGCERGRTEAPPARVDVAVRPATELAPATPRVTTAEGAPAEVEAGRCEGANPPTIANGWRLHGFSSAPPLTDALGLGRRGERLLGVTQSAVCLSDEGIAWRTVLGADAGLSTPTLHRLAVRESAVVIAQGTPTRPTAPRVLESRDLGERWEPVALPDEAAAAGPEARVFTDGVRRLFVVTPRALWVRFDDGPWLGPRALPGERAGGVDVCGETLIARATVGRDGFWHRSEDYGVSWRPFRLGTLGLEGADTVVRCLGWRGIIEAGRVPLPSYWSLDQGRSWHPARYDHEARALARTLVDDPSLRQSPPRCSAGFGNTLVCTQHQRLTLVDTDAPWDRDRPAQRVIRPPSGCPHLRLVDDRRVLAFGEGCGVYVSTDLGGRWRTLASRGNLSEPPELINSSNSQGHGGWIDEEIAWRLDGGIWWTHDHGAHWRLLPSTGGRLLTHGVFVDASRGVFARSDGWVVSTRDAGRSWRFVMRGEAERIAAAGPWITATTPSAVFVSSDGGASWRGGRALPAGQGLDPVLRVEGRVRRFDPKPGLTVLQEGATVSMATRDNGVARTELVRNLPAGVALLSAWVSHDAITRILFAGGWVLSRE